MSFENAADIESITGILNGFEKRSLGPLSSLAASVGITVTDTITDIKTETDIAIPISLNNWPTGRFNVTTGINTITVVKADPSIGAQTCLAPL